MSGDAFSMTVTPAAAAVLRRAAAQSGVDEVVVRVAAKLTDGELTVGFGFDEPRDQDARCESAGVTVLVSPPSRPLLQGVEMDFIVDDDRQTFFVFRQPDSGPGRQDS